MEYLLSVKSYSHKIIKKHYNKYKEKEFWVYTFKYMVKNKIQNVKTLALVAGIIVLGTVLFVFLPQLQKQKAAPYVENVAQLGSDLRSVTKPLGISLALSDNEVANFSCNKERLPTLEKKDYFWQNICENRLGAPYIGIFWKRLDFKKTDFQNGVLNAFLKNKSAQENKIYKGTFSCVEAQPVKDVTKMRSIVADCTTTIENSTTKLYTTFIYSYPVQSVALNASTVIVVSGTQEQDTHTTGNYLFGKLHKISTTSPKTASSVSLIERAYASGGAAGAGDGGAAGTGSCRVGTGDTGACATGDAAATGDSGVAATGDTGVNAPNDAGTSIPSVCTNGGTDWPTCTAPVPPPTVEIYFN